MFQIFSLQQLTSNIIVVGVELGSSCETQAGEELVAGEDESGQYGQVERHEHGEVSPGVDRLHDGEQEWLQYLVSVGWTCSEPGLHQSQYHEDTLVLEVSVLRAQLLHHHHTHSLHHLQRTQQHVSLEDVDCCSQVLRTNGE